MLHRIFRAIPILDDMERMKVDPSSQSETALQRLSRRRELEVQEEEFVWTGNPFWIVNFWFYFARIIYAGVLTAIVFFLRQFLLDNGVFTQQESEQWFILAYVAVWSFFLIRCFFRFLATKLTRYILTNRKLMVHSGLILRRKRRAFLNRVTDYSPSQFLWQRPFRRSNIVIITGDSDMQEVTFRWIKKGPELVALLDHLVYNEELRFPVGLLAGNRGMDNDSDENQHGGRHHHDTN